MGTEPHSLEERVAAVIHKANVGGGAICTDWCCDGPTPTDRRAASAVVAEFGLTQETEWGLRCFAPDDVIVMDKDAATRRADAYPLRLSVVQRDVLTSPWRSAS